MTRAGGLALSFVLLVCAAPARALAGGFDDLLQAAEPPGTGGVAALFWAQAGGCDDEKTELDKRVCRVVHDARRLQRAGKTFVVGGDVRALDVGAWDAKRKSAPVAVRPCFACAAPVDVDGKKLFVTGAGAVQTAGGAVTPEPMHRTAMVAATEAEDAAWRQKVLPRLKLEFIVRLPSGLQSWDKDGVKGARLEVLGFRLYDPCDGKVVAADPAAAPVAADRAACGEVAVVAPTPTEPPPPVDNTPKLAARLSPAQITSGLSAARAAADKCYVSYGVPGRASFRITVSPAGQVTGLEQSGDFLDTPTGACIEKAVRASTFPAISRPMTFDYPFVLR